MSLIIFNYKSAPQPAYENNLLLPAAVVHWKFVFFLNFAFLLFCIDGSTWRVTV